MDPRTGPVTIQISGTSAQLLGKLAEQLEVDDGGAVMMRALGLLDLAMSARRSGRKLQFFDPVTGAVADVAF